MWGIWNRGRKNYPHLATAAAATAAASTGAGGPASATPISGTVVAKHQAGKNKCYWCGLCFLHKILLIRAGTRNAWEIYNSMYNIYWDFHENLSENERFPEQLPHIKKRHPRGTKPLFHLINHNWQKYSYKGLCLLGLHFSHFFLCCPKFFFRCFLLSCNSSKWQESCLTFILKTRGLLFTDTFSFFFKRINI